MNRLSRKNPISGFQIKPDRKKDILSSITPSIIKAHQSDVIDAAISQREASSHLSYEKIKTLRTDTVLSNSKELVKKTRKGSYQFSK